MRILNIMLAHGLGGVETMALRYHEALIAAGFEVVSVGPEGGVLARHVPAEQFQSLTARINHDPFAALRLRRIAADFRPDLILTHGNRATGLSLLPFLGTAPKTIQVVHNFRHKPQIARLRAAIAVSAPVRDSLRKDHPRLGVHMVDNFAALSRHPVKPAPSGVPVLGTLSRLHVNKGLDTVLDAIATLRDRGVAVRLKLAGDGPLKRELMMQVRTLGLEDRVEFCGWVDPSGDYLHGLDLFLSPSRVEPFGLVVTESMAAGVPVVATDIDGPRQILAGGAYGYLCAREDPHAMADAILSVLSDWPAALAKARRAQSHALAHFSLEAGTRRLRDALQEIAQNPAMKA